jgi:hypothetical protein
LSNQRKINFNKSNNTFLRQHSVNFSLKNETDDKRPFKQTKSQQQNIESPNITYSNSKDLALANKTNKVNGVNQQQNKTLNSFNQLGSNSKFKPINNENYNKVYFIVYQSKINK